jgi:predicted phage tail protein
MAATEELFKIAARVLLQQVATPYRVAFERRIIGAALCGVMASIAVIAAVVCAVAAVRLWLTPLLGETGAALVTMGIMLVIAIVLGLVAAMLVRRAPAAALHDALGSKDIAGLIEGHVPQLMIAAAIGGLFFATKRRK